MNLCQLIESYLKNPNEFRKEYGGFTVSVYIPIYNSSQRQDRNQTIILQYRSGVAINKLSRQFKLSERQIRRIIEK